MLRNAVEALFLLLITYVPGKCLRAADTLSQAPVQRDETPADKELFEDTNIYMDIVMENLPASVDYWTS